MIQNHSGCHFCENGRQGRSRPRFKIKRNALLTLQICRSNEDKFGLLNNTLINNK
jgi:hypothetical protein